MDATISTSENFSPKEIQQIIVQLYEIFRLEILYYFINCDSHGDNSKILKYDKYVLTRQLDFGKIIFGKEKIDIKNRFAGIDYMFFQKTVGSTKGSNNRGVFEKITGINFMNAAETIKRSLRSENSPSNKKHWPLHKLLAVIGFEQEQIYTILTTHGNKIKSIGMSDDSEFIESVFNETIYEIDNLIELKLTKGREEEKTLLADIEKMQDNLPENKILKNRHQFLNYKV
jgi:hypothetical protein